MSKKKSSPTKNMKNKGGNNKSGKKKAVVAPSSKKRWIIAGAALALAIALTVILILVFAGSDNDVDLAAAEASLKNAGYSVGNYVPELNGYNGVVKALAATYEKGSFDTLADYVNAEKEVVNLVQFNNEENAEIAYEIFCAKWSDKYDEYGLVGNTIYFGTDNACDLAVIIVDENN